MIIRAIIRAVKVEGAPAQYDTVFAKIYYPAVYGGTLMERNTGVLSADPTHTPMPVVIFLSGINVGKEAYQWWAVELAKAGIVTVTYDWIAEDLPGFISLTAGVDLTSLAPNVYGTKPTSTVIAPLLGMVERLQADGVLAGALDLNNVFLGGHSAGATMAFQNANPAWFPQVRGAFGYAGHTMASTMFGYAVGTILPVLSDLPVLIMGGTDDGVIAASSHRYGLTEGSASAAVERTFDDALQNGYLVLFKDAGHFVAAYPHDPTTGRGFLEEDEPKDETELRELIAMLTVAFIRGEMSSQRWGERPLIVEYREK
jgi:pimeloyl-ACP methyl ester carboxylesterase